MGYPPQGNRDHEVRNSVIHDTHIFPEDTPDALVFTAGAIANEWSAWALIVDAPAGNIFHGEFTTVHGHISGITIETVSNNGQIYILEISYGASNIQVAATRFYGGAVPKQSERIRSVIIPAGEIIYYRMKCETGGATAEGHIRHYHPT